jgi:hypothetical protein
MTAASDRPHNVALLEVPLNAGCVPFGWEPVVSKTTNTAVIYTVGEEAIVSEPVPRGSLVVERGLASPERSG